MKKQITLTILSLLISSLAKAQDAPMPNADIDKYKTAIYIGLYKKHAECKFNFFNNRTDNSPFEKYRSYDVQLSDFNLSTTGSINNSGQPVLTFITHNIGVHKFKLITTVKSSPDHKTIELIKFDYYRDTIMNDGDLINPIFVVRPRLIESSECLIK